MKIFAMFKRELVDGLRGRRALFAAMSFALLGPVVIVFAINVTAGSTRESALAPFRLCGEGAAPDLLAHLAAGGLKVADSARVCLDVPADYAERLSAGGTAHVRVVADLAAGGGTAAALEREINAFSRTLAMQRLMSRGVSPSIVRPIDVEMQSTNRVSNIASLVGNMLILYVLYAPFIIVYAMAGDASAGERERHSLEPLLTHPVHALHVVMGKFLALAAVNLTGTALTVAVTLVLVERSAMPELGLRVETGFATGATAFLWLAPLCMLVAAAQLVLGLYSKTAKEAQQTSMLVSFVPVLVGMVVIMRQGVDVGPWPVAWEIRALAGPLLGSTTALAPFPLVAGLELAAAALILLAGARRLRGERVLG
jgi:sodium transport system permease protein